MATLEIQAPSTLTVCQYLRPVLNQIGLTDVYVGKTVPNPRRDKMVIVKSVGGSLMQGHLAKSMVDIVVWSKDELDADQISEFVCAIMLNADTETIMDVRTITRPTDINPTGTDVPQRFMRFSVLTRPTSTLTL